MRSNGAVWRAALGTLLAVATLSASPASGSQAVVRDPAPQPLEAELVKLGKLIANANAKLRTGAVGVGTIETAPAELCCAANLKRMWVRFEEAEALLDEFGKCYEGKRAHPMVTQVEIAKVDLEGVSRTVDAFAKASTPRDASGALDSVTRAYLHLRRSAAPLEPCGDVAWREQLDVGEPDGKGPSKAKRGRKKN